MTLNHIKLFIIVIAVVGCSVTRQHINQDNYYLAQTCGEMNGDVTRPDNRQCVNPVSFEHGLFTFITKGGIVEQYLVIEDSNGDSVYTFVDYLEE